MIEKTLRHAAALHRPSDYPAEVVLVNNLCTDDTVPRAQDLWDRLNHPFDLVVVNEPTPGLSYARHRGIEVSRYDYLLFCDDDNRLAPDYLQKAEALLHQKTNVAALGGFGIPDYEAVPKHWPHDFYIYGCGPQAEKSGLVNYVHGAGVIVRKEALQQLKQVGFSFLLTDRKGKQLSSGGDYELCYAIRLAGYSVWYEQALTFQHYITAERLSIPYCQKFIRESTPALDILDVYKYCLQGNAILYPDFYFQQLKILIYHGYKIYRSYRYRSKYSGDEKIAFLEGFHIAFHRARIKCMLRSALKYRHWARHVRALKKAMQALDG